MPYTCPQCLPFALDLRRQLVLDALQLHAVLLLLQLLLLPFLCQLVFVLKQPIDWLLLVVVAFLTRLAGVLSLAGVLFLVLFAMPIVLNAVVVLPVVFDEQSLFFLTPLLIALSAFLPERAVDVLTPLDVPTVADVPFLLVAVLHAPVLNG